MRTVKTIGPNRGIHGEVLKMPRPSLECKLRAGMKGGLPGLTKKGGAHQRETDPGLLQEGGECRRRCGALRAGLAQFYRKRKVLCLLQDRKRNRCKLTRESRAPRRIGKREKGYKSPVLQPSGPTNRRAGRGKGIQKAWRYGKAGAQQRKFAASSN